MSDAAHQAEFLALLNVHRGVLHRISRGYSRTPADREDLFNDIVFQLWRAFPSFRREALPVTWIYRVALNTAITATRRQSRRPIHVPLDVAGEVASRAEPADDPRLTLLYRAIGQLDDIDRAVILCHLDELSYRRIGEVLGISESYVGVKLHRIKAKLQDLISTAEDTNGT